MGNADGGRFTHSSAMLTQRNTVSPLKVVLDRLVVSAEPMNWAATTNWLLVAHNERLETLQ